MMIKCNIHLFQHNSEENVGNHDNETMLHTKKPMGLNFALKLMCACDIILITISIPAGELMSTGIDWPSVRL